jgi:CDP-diacylglycerol---glycerol-3-phosphate 3-phosphatidyltransferase
MNVPNILSVIRIILSPVFLYLYLTGDVFLQRLSLVIFFIAVLTDWYDGWYARKYKSITKTGIFLDPLADKILTTFAFILFYMKNMLPYWMLIIIAIRDIVITILRSYDEYRGLTIRTSKIAKTKTFLQMTYIFFILGLFILPTFNIEEKLKISVNDFLFNSATNYTFMLVITLITLYTGFSYFIEKRHYKNNEIN